ncbi:hypothetical protein BU23DRAFT_589620 [Bimuria novae-zelandiae CBS 107.79]|uniref:Uncharacterized protein n=1 Tax=Bimuria novae-zelandiae CBS 107.79 TaxID=1447943 RepID=A0A6A5V949_9PLEO|nr:hypothetical protein BU23DRAFT_589620 [Bimuria novae-zelandiae CBS 107.79]
MSGPPPPLGESWFPNVGGNIAMNRDPIPPPFDPPNPPPYPPPGPPSAAAEGAAASAEANGNAEQIFPPTMTHHLPGIPLAHSLGPFPPPMMGMGMGMPGPFGPMMGMGMGFGMDHVQSAGPLAPPRMPWNTPGLLGNPSTQHGACVPGMPWLGFEKNMDGPPAPPGIGEGVPPFAPGAPLWAGGAIPGLGAMGMNSMAMGMGMGMGVGFYPGMYRPAPGIMCEALAEPQPPQGDITSLPGGVPPGMTHVESTEHSIIHLLKGPVFPWLNHGMPMEVEILFASCSTSINRLIEACNNNQDCEGYGVSEVHEMVNGTWEKGQTFLYGEPMSMVLTLGDAGWGKDRNRPGGRSLHIYLHKV